MAHKHNRRRVRPRNRNHSPLNPACDELDDLSSTSSESSIDFSTNSSSPSASYRQAFIPSAPRNHNASISSIHWHNRYTAWQNRDKAQKREAANIEAEQLKLFGGVPGDDVGLCYKMMEVFEGMDWIE